MMKGVFPPRPNSQVCAFLPSFFCFCQVYSSPFFFVISSLHVCTCVSPFATIFLYLYAYFPTFAKTFEGPGVAADAGMPSATAPATPIVPVYAIPTAPVSAVPSVPISAILSDPIPTGPGQFLISSLISFSRVYCSCLTVSHVTFHAPCQVCCLLSLLSLRWVVVLPWFQTPWVRPLPFLHILINMILTTLTPQTSGVPALHMWTFMVSGFPRIAFLT